VIKVAMRIPAAIVFILLGSSVALAETDPQAPYGPQAATIAGAAHAQAKPQPRAVRRPIVKPKAKPARPAKPAAKPAAPATPKPATAAPKPAPPIAKKQLAKPRQAPAKPKRPAAKPKPELAEPGPAAVEKPEAKPAPIDPGLRESYAAIPLTERVALQSDLIWTGDYNGLINGEFSERLVEAVRSYQKRQNAKPTGMLNPQERAALRSAARPRQTEVGWRLTEDPATGARIGLPLKLATKREAAATGTRWSSQQGQLQIETFRIDTGATLEGVFEQQKKTPPQRRATYNVLRDGFFVVSGTQGLKKFYVRGFAQDGEVRGITILYDQAEAIMDSMVVAISNAFSPFTSYAVAGAPEAPPRKRVDYATGVVVSASGNIVTARQAVDGCHVIVIPGFGHAERVATQTGGELALLRIYGARKLAPIALSAATGPGPATLVGIAEPQAQGGGAAVTTVAAKVGGGIALLALEPPPASGFSGAAALDGKGALLGVVVLKPAVVAGVSIAPQAVVVPVATVRDFLKANDIALADGPVGIEHAKASAVRVICVRK
jgi:peptidoglycan hydrolase-like protein with peptidoglycan-binding domain